MFNAKANDRFFCLTWVLECQFCLVEQMESLPSTCSSVLKGPVANLKPKKPFGLKLDCAILGTSADNSTDSSKSAEQELKCYLASPLAGEEVDPMCWWQMNQHLYPHCALIACKTLATPGK